MIAQFLILAALCSVINAKIHQDNFNHDKEKIIGGVEVPINEYPYQVYLHNLRMNSHCGGSIISKYHILTAGHCVCQHFHPSEIRVRSGSASKLFGGSQANAYKIICHPEFRKFAQVYLNDIAIVVLPKPLTFDASTKSIPMSGPNEARHAGQTASISGWGANDQLQQSPRLKATNVRLVDDRVCQKHSTFDSRVICASYPKRNVCFGDSGGPLAVSGLLVGVAIASTCHETTVPSFYASVAFYRDWIDRMMKVVPTENDAGSQFNGYNPYNQYYNQYNTQPLQQWNGYPGYYYVVDQYGRYYYVNNGVYQYSG